MTFNLTRQTFTSIHLINACEDDVAVHWMLRCAALVYKLMLSKHIHSLLSKQQSGSLCTYSTAELIIAATPRSPSQYLSTFLFLLRPFFLFLSLSLLSPALCSATHVNHIVHLLSSVPERVGLSARALQSFHMFALSLNNYRMWVVVSFSHFDSFIILPSGRLTN